MFSTSNITNYNQSYHLGQMHVSGLLFNICSDSRQWIQGNWTKQLRRGWSIDALRRGWSSNALRSRCPTTCVQMTNACMKIKVKASQLPDLYAPYDVFEAHDVPKASLLQDFFAEQDKHDLVHAICHNAHLDEKDRIPFWMICPVIWSSRHRVCR